MKRFSSDMIKLLDTTTPDNAAFSMILEGTKQHALDKWQDKENARTDVPVGYYVGKDDLMHNIRVRRERLSLDPEGDWRDILFYKTRPMFAITWNVKTQMIKVEDYE